MNEGAMQAVTLWVGLNIGLMFLLAMNVVRYRRMGEAADPARLEGAIRAHGNNTEYVPVILLGMAMLAAMGVSANSIHILGGGLLVCRVLHADGMQRDGVPVSRIIGNVGTWIVMLAVVIALVSRGLPL